MSQTTALSSLLGGRSRWRNYLAGGILTAAAYVAIAWQSAGHLGRPHLVTGYSLLGIIAFLAAFNLRKRLPMLPLMRSRVWTVLHVCGGVLALAVYWLHTGRLWPVGTYEQALAAVFYLTSGSGLLGLVIQSLQPSRLTQTGIEVLYERIPNEVAGLRRRAEELLLDCTRETGNDTLARYYVETLQWFFCAPRFTWAHIRGSQTAEFWLEQRFATVRRYLNTDERTYLARLAELAEDKTALDSHFAGQLLLRAWLLLHVPCVAAVLTLAVWHMLLVHIYAL